MDTAATHQHREPTLAQPANHPVCPWVALALVLNLPDERVIRPLHLHHPHQEDVAQIVAEGHRVEACKLQLVFVMVGELLPDCFAHTGGSPL